MVKHLIEHLYSANLQHNLDATNHFEDLEESLREIQILIWLIFLVLDKLASALTSSILTISIFCFFGLVKD